MKNTILTLMLFYSITFLAQNRKAKDLDSICGQFMEKLRVEKIDTISIYESYSTGSSKLLTLKPGQKLDDCLFSIVPKDVYFFWKKGGKTFSTKKNDCFDYPIVEIHDSNLWKIFFQNRTEIESEKPKRFQSKSDGFITNVHSSYRDFKFIIQNKTVKQKFDLFDFIKKEKYRENPRENLSFKFNQKLKSKVVMDILENLSKKIDSKYNNSKQKRE
jgi:hypothetical protein